MRRRVECLAGTLVGPDLSPEPDVAWCGWSGEADGTFRRGRFVWVCPACGPTQAQAA